MVHGQWNGAKRIWLSPKALVRFAPSQNWGEALPKPTEFSARFVPGALRQQYFLGNLQVNHELVFVGRRLATVRVLVANTGRAALGVQFNFEGGVGAAGQPLKAKGDFVTTTVPMNEAARAKVPEAPVVEVRFDPSLEFKISSKEEGAFFAKAADPLLLMPGQQRAAYYTVSLCLEAKELDEARELAAQVFRSPESFFQRAAKRWDGYIRAAVGDVGSNGPTQLQRVAAKAVSTLVLNWRGASGSTLLHDGVQPSITTFHGFWAWDSWKHAAAISMFDLELAKAQIRVMFDFQGTSGGKEGMVPDKANLPPEGGQAWGNTKPPLAAWAAWLVYLRGEKDLPFLQEIFPKLEAYHRWWFTYRDHDQNGLCEFGATGNNTVAAKWESGMDNAPRFDGVKRLLKNGPKGGGWSAAQESVDLSSFLYAEKGLLARMADSLGLPGKASEHREAARKLRDQAQRWFFDEERGYFFDRSLGEDRVFLGPMGCEAFAALWSGLASKEQAARVREHIMNPSKFFIKVPFGTVSSDAPEFKQNGYWRGPVWLDQAYFAIRGLERYGYVADANKGLEQLLGEVLKDPVPRENYNPLTGAGQGAQFFGWSAASLLMLSTPSREDLPPSDDED